jgi:ankyrin repeat protein
MRKLMALLALMVTATTAAASDPLYDAISNGDKAAVTQALAKGEYVDIRTSDQATPLMSAALAGNADIVELLLSKGANVMARNAGGLTPLHAAAYAGSVPVAELLLQKGALLDDAANKGGVTPLMVAGEQGHLELAQFLIGKGADVNHGEVHGYKPIARALWKGNKDIVRLYKQHGATCVAPEIRGAEDWYRQCVEISQ